MKLAHIVISTLLYLLIGCSTVHDPKLAKIPEFSCNLQSGVSFHNTPSDIQENHLPQSLSEYLGHYNKAISRVDLVRNNNGLVAKFYDQDNNVIQSKKGSLIKYESSGKRIIINKWRSCKPGEAGVGCTWGRVELSCTKSQDMIVRRITKGAGLLVLIVPFGGGNEHISIYRRLQ